LTALPESNAQAPSIPLHFFMLTSKHGAGVSTPAWRQVRNTRNLLDGRFKAGPWPVYPTRITKKPQNYSGRATQCNLAPLNRAPAPPFGGAPRGAALKSPPCRNPF